MKLEILENLLIDIYSGKYSPNGIFTNLKNTNVRMYVDILFQSEVKEEDLIIPFEEMTGYFDKCEYFKEECFNYRFDDIERLKMLAFAYSLEVPLLKSLLEEEFQLRLREYVEAEPQTPIQVLEKQLFEVMERIYGFKPNMTLLDVANFCYKSSSIHWLLNKYIEQKRFKFWTSSHVLTMLVNQYQSTHKDDIKYLDKNHINYFFYKGELDWFPNFYSSPKFLKIYRKALRDYKKNFLLECPYFNEDYLKEIR